MPKATITIFDEEKITHKGMDPDLKVILDKISKDGIEIKLEINLKRHNFDRSAHVFFQAYNNRGAGMKPWPMGSIKDLNTSEINTFSYFVPNIEKDDARFSLFVSMTGSFNKINVNRIIGTAKITDFYDEPENAKEDNFKSESLLPTREDEIGTAFRIDMMPGKKPTLVLKRGCNIKHKLDNNIDPIQKTLIYTSAIRALLKTYLSDTRYEDCPWKHKWFDEIRKKLGDLESVAPDSLLDIDNKETSTNPEAELWIEEVATTFVSNLIDATGKKLIDKFISNNNYVGSTENEEGDL